MIAYSMELGPPEIYRGFDQNGARIKVETSYTPVQYPRFSLSGNIDKVFSRRGIKRRRTGYIRARPTPVPRSSGRCQVFRSVGQCSVEAPVGRSFIDTLSETIPMARRDHSGRRQTYQEGPIGSPLPEVRRIVRRGRRSAFPTKNGQVLVRSRRKFLARI